jgi:protein ImuA
MHPESRSAPEVIHPALWRASQLAHSTIRCIDTGHPVLNHELPGGGWPHSALTEIHAAQAGVGELRLIAPIFSKAGKCRPVMFVQTPQIPNALALAAMGLDPSHVIWVQPDRTADALFTTEQMLRDGGGATVLLWQNHTRTEHLRRLNLAAQGADANLLFVFRPLASAHEASPAPLRLALHARAGGLDISIIKRRGAQLDGSIFVPLSPLFSPRHHAPMDQRTLSELEARGIRAELVG